MIKKNKKIIATALAVAMAFSLTACGDTHTAGEDVTVSKESAGRVDNGTLKDDSVVIAVGNTKVTYVEYKVYSYLLKNKYETIMGDGIWNYSAEEGRTIGQDAIEEIIRLIIQLKVIGKNAGSVGVTLGADEKEDLTYKAQQYLATLSEEEKQAAGLTEAMVTTVLTDNEVARKVYDVITGQVDVNIADADAVVVDAQVILYMTQGTNKNGEAINLDEAGKTKEYEKAQAALAKISSGESFYAIAGSESSLSDIEMTIGKEDTPAEMVAAAFNLKENEVSQVISTDTGYYIVKCLSNGNAESTATHKQEMIVKRQTEAFQNSYKTWSAAYEVHVSKSLVASTTEAAQ